MLNSREKQKTKARSPPALLRRGERGLFGPMASLPLAAILGSFDFSVPTASIVRLKFLLSLAMDRASQHQNNLLFPCILRSLVAMLFWIGAQSQYLRMFFVWPLPLLSWRSFPRYAHGRVPSSINKRRKRIFEQQTGLCCSSVHKNKKNQFGYGSVAINHTTTCTSSLHKKSREKLAGIKFFFSSSVQNLSKDPRLLPLLPPLRLLLRPRGGRRDLRDKDEHHEGIGDASATAAAAAAASQGQDLRGGPEGSGAQQRLPPQERQRVRPFFPESKRTNSPTRGVIS